MPYDTFATPPLAFAPLTDEVAEMTLKAALVPLLRKHGEVKRAYLARVRYDDGRTGGLVLGLVTPGEDNEDLVAAIAKCFGSLFDSSQHLDIIFVSDAQLAAIHKVAAAFYVRQNVAFRLVASLLRLFMLMLLVQPFIATLAARPALACACCSERGSRVDHGAQLDASTRVQIERMVFAKEAALGGGDTGPSPLPMGASSNYALTVTHNKSLMTFAFKDPPGRTSRLSFVIPPRIWIFAVDPFGDARDEGLGPNLYKEWRLIAPVKSDGIFRTPFGQTATLIFHGRGRGCTEAEHFTDWSLMLQGPAGKATFYGRLEKP